MVRPVDFTETPIASGLIMSSVAREPEPLPSWLTPPLPVNVIFDLQAIEEVDRLVATVVPLFVNLHNFLTVRQSSREYDPLVQRANAVIWRRRQEFWTSDLD